MLTEAPWAGRCGDGGLLGFGCRQLTARGPVCCQKTRQKLAVRQEKGRSFLFFGEMEDIQTVNIETLQFIHVRQEGKKNTNEQHNYSSNLRLSAVQNSWL